MATDIIITAMPMAMPAVAIRTIGVDKRGVSLPERSNFAAMNPEVLN